MVNKLISLVGIIGLTSHAMSASPVISVDTINQLPTELFIEAAQCRIGAADQQTRSSTESLDQYLNRLAAQRSDGNDDIDEMTIVMKLKLSI